MYIVAYRLINLLNDSEYDSTEAHIAESLLGIIKEIEHMPIDQVADKCHISKSTLSKFVKRLGLKTTRNSVTMHAMKKRGQDIITTKKKSPWTDSLNNTVSRDS